MRARPQEEVEAADAQNRRRTVFRQPGRGDLARRCSSFLGPTQGRVLLLFGSFANPPALCALALAARVRGAPPTRRHAHRLSQQLRGGPVGSPAEVEGG